MEKEEKPLSDFGDWGLGIGDWGLGIGDNAVEQTWCVILIRR